MKLVKDADQLRKSKKTVSDEKAEEAIRTIIEWIGENPSREGLSSTPKRVIKAFREYFKGYTEDPSKFLAKTFSEVEGYDDMVIEINISIQSHCKLARVVEVFSKRLQTQERLTMQIAKTIMDVLQPRGVAVTIDASHQCMTNRGVKKENATTVTNYFLGAFKDDLSFQNRYLRYINKY